MNKELQKYAERELARGHAIKQAEIDENRHRREAHSERVARSSDAFNSLVESASETLLSVEIQLGVAENRTDTNGHTRGKLYVKVPDGRDSVLGHVCVTDNNHINLYSFGDSYEHICDVALAEAVLVIIKRATQVYTR
jgi:hypothetical protein